MQPTLNPEENGKPRHEWVYVNRLPSKSYRYHQGDVVMLRYVILVNSNEDLPMILNVF